MEAVPRLPMLSFDLKVSPESTSFGPKLKQYIRDVYHEDPEMYSNEIHTLEGLRAQAVCAVRDVTGCSALKRYYCQLHFLQSRFPMAKDGAAAVSFTWRDTYANMVCNLADIRFEMVSILYNIGALHTQLGAADSRVTADGMKLSCTHFQCAAWAFQHLKDTFPQPAGVDLAPDVMQFMYHLCLAQAQECILEKSMMDNRKATIIAKVAVQIVDYYNLALNTLEQSGSDDCSVAETVGSKIFKNWKRYVKFKIAYHSCVSLLFQGQQAEEQQKMGERVSYYQAASEKLEEAMKLSKGMDNIEAINEALTFTMDVVEGKKKAAKNENEFIYHEEVPDKDSLPDVKGASLVKGIPFNVNDPEVSGQDIFARLVPMKAHEASSLYSEEKAKLLRRVGVMVDEKDQELVTFMTSLQLDHLNIHSEPDRLPQELVDRCAALSAKPNAIQNLVEAMNKLADTYHDVEGMLQDIKELIQMEETKEKEYQEIMGKRPPSIVATDLTREANKYQEAHAKASESNQTLHKAMTLHISNLKVLSLPLDELQKQIPTVSVLDSPIDESSVKEMQHLVSKVEEMRRQRAMLATQLRESTCQDDITRQLVTRTGESLDTIFSQEMQKHQRYVSLIEQNLSAQDNILKALTEAYARYAGTRKATNEIIRKREATINALISSYDAYEDLLAKSSKGLEFYRKLETNVNKLLQRVKGTCKVQEEERDQILAKNNKTLPSSRPLPTSDRSSTESPIPSSGPKLKDYLHGMKRGSVSGVGGYVAGYPSATGAQAPSAYYNTSLSGYGQVPAPVASPQPSSYYDQTVSGTSGSQLPAESVSSQQWVPAVRPAPVGSEGTSDQTAAVKLEPSENKITLPPQGYSFPGLPASSDQSTALKVGAAYRSAAMYSEYGVSQYNYSNASVVQPPAYIQQQPQEQPTFSQGQASSVGQTSTYNYTTPYMQQYDMSSQAAVSGYAPGSAVIAGSSVSTYPSDTKTYVTQPQLNQQPNQYTPAMSQQYQSLQPSYQQGGTMYPSNSNVNYTDITEQKVPDSGSYYMPSSTPQNYVVGAYTSQNYPATSTQQPASTSVASSMPQSLPEQSQVPAVSGVQLGYTYDNATSNAYQYGSNYQGSKLGYPGQSPQPTMWPQQSQATNIYAVSSANATTTTTTTTSTTTNTGSYYGSEFHASNSATSLSSGSSSEVSISNPHYYSATMQQYQQYPQTYSYPTTSQAGVYSSQQATEVQSYALSKPNVVNPSASSTEFQYMTATGASYYTNAGTYGTSQTCSSQTSIEGQTYAVQYNANQSATTYQTPGYSQASYYSLPYGYQYGVDSVTGTPPQSPHHVQHTNYPVCTTFNHTPQSPMTYMQARDQNNSTVTTYTQQGGSSLSSSSVQDVKCNGIEKGTSSNVDLLAGLDFSLNQAPLEPQQPATTSAWKEEEQKPAVSGSSNIKQTPAPSGVNIPASTNQISSIVPKKTELPSVSSTVTATSSLTALPQTNGVDSDSANEKPGKDTLPVSTLSVSGGDTNQDEGKLISKAFGKDPYTDPEALNQFVQEVGKYEKFVDGLTNKTLNGPTPLDMKWKELLDLQEKDAHKRSISVARCYPMKNRFPDILPYDHSRIELPSTKDDYINASYMKNLTPLTPPFIVTQAPLPSTYTDFWTMVWEQQVEVIVCLLNDSELQGQVYWPIEKGQELAMGKMKLTLQSSNVRSHWVERIVSVTAVEARVTRVIVHLQFTAWPGSSFPASPGPFLSFVSETLNFYSQQRGACHPVVVHCLSGVGRTGLFCLVTAAVCEIQAGRGLLDLVTTTAVMSTHRKGSLRDREHLKFAYQAVLYYAQDLLMKFAVNSNNSEGKHDADVQLQSCGSRKSSIVSSRRSSVTSVAGSRSSSPNPHLSMLPSGLAMDLTRFNLNAEGTPDKSRRRFTRENFTSKTKGANLELTHEKSDDPLSQLDPLWPLKRL
ncbi:tyrosine-protein phosphatase non-receptor type 23 isoform X3 [Periplaneta americana]|uniref:tyrosine-protein phosphatase non-receptor type 23 isoform X3 n=1 Tax=Periplaneta americana TaxID=6978 RepID=UPI0037E8EA03